MLDRRNRRVLSLLIPALAIPALTLGCGGGDEPAPPAEPPAAEAPTPPAPSGPLRLAVPDERAETETWLARRAAEQREQALEWQVPHDFRFRDRIEDSGIDFVHQIVDDAGPAYKAVHYDHGTAVAAADVDGDGLLDLYFGSQRGSNRLYRNLGDGRFEDVTEAAGVGLADRICVGASFADVDNDGDADLYVTSVRGRNAMFLNDGSGTFSDASESSGLDYEGHSSGAVWFDYDRDGLLDLLVLNIGTYTRDVRGEGEYWVGHKDAFGGHLKPERAEQSRLFRNLGDVRFEDVTDAVGLSDVRWSGDATPIDANGDGWPDLYVLNMQGLDGYWENQQGKRFVDRTAEVFPRSSWGAMGVKAFDLENDGDADLFVTDMHSDMVESLPPRADVEKVKALSTFPPEFLMDDGKGIYGNSFFRQDEAGRFSEVSDEIGAENFWPWGLSVDDLNADGFDDAFVTSSMNYPFRYGINSLLLNDEGRGFLDAEFVLGVEPRKDGEILVEWFELDCAGEDRYHRDCPKQGSPGQVTVSGALGSRSSVIFDLEGDGDLDIVTNEFGSPPMVLVSDLSERQPVQWLAVDLVGSRSNRDGLGAHVQVVAGDRTVSKFHDGLSGYLGKSRKPLYFGLGDAQTVDAIVVRWPSGVEQRLAGPIETRRTLEIVEPAS